MSILSNTLSNTLFDVLFSDVIHFISCSHLLALRRAYSACQTAGFVASPELPKFNDLLELTFRANVTNEGKAK